MLKTDGRFGIYIFGTSGLTISGLEIEGPAQRISSAQASQNRERITGRDENGCGQYAAASCLFENGCKWSSGLNYCIGQEYYYYSNQCVRIQLSNVVTLDSNSIHHCTSTGVAVDQSDNTLISNNSVYGNAWWTHDATSGIVFTNSRGWGSNRIVDNAVYGNRNFIPYFNTYSQPSNFYGSWDSTTIIDGQGVLIAGNTYYEGTIYLKDNVAFDNGINGLVVHRATNEGVNTIIEGNNVFDNGRTTTDVEGRRLAGGLTVNSGTATATSEALLINNKVSVLDSDITY